MQLREAIGRAIGGLLAPLAFEGSLIRKARLFHPDGVVYGAHVTPLAAEGPAADIAQRLAGPAIIRFSGAIWRAGKRAAMPDILGAAIRFTRTHEVSAKACASDQDLLFLTIPSIWLLPIGPFTTNARDYLANTYHTDLPFTVEGIGQIKLRLVTSGVGANGPDRKARLEHAVSLGLGVLHLEVQIARSGARWMPVAAIELRGPAQVDQEDLRLNPFRTGRGIHPTGFFQAVRAAVYPASQIGRRIARGPR